MNRAQAMTQDLAALFKARNALIWIVTREEARAERSILDAAKAAKYDVKMWDCAAGSTGFNDKGEAVSISQSGDPQAVLQQIRNDKKRAIWVLRDIPLWLRDPLVLRAVRNLARELPNAVRDQARGMVLLSPQSEVPPELAGHAVVVEWPLPDREEISELLDGAISALPDEIARTIQPTSREAAIDAAVGLTAEEAQSCYAKSLVTAKTIDPKAVATEKKRVIARERVLEWFDPDPRGLDAVGGLDNLKRWLLQRRAAFTQRAREFGLPAPKGLLMVGIPGTGKSLSAKAVATAWGMPLLRMDLGALKSKWVGESEANIRKALAVAEAVAPAILWLDEIEKALAGAVQGAADGGVSADALGAILNWLQERKANVFVMATSNDVSQLPPELLRKGRFDEIFWVDLPTREERKQILAVTLRQYGRQPDGIDLDRLAAETVDFTGSEIASLIPDALFAAFADGERALSTADLLSVRETVVPLAKTAAERIKALRAWAKGRARPASTAAVEEAREESRTMTGGRKLDL